MSRGLALPGAASSCACSRSSCFCGVVDSGFEARHLGLAVVTEDTALRDGDRDLGQVRGTDGNAAGGTHPTKTNHQSIMGAQSGISRYESVDARRRSLISAFTSSFSRFTSRLAVTTRSSKVTTLELAMKSSSPTFGSVSTASSRSRHAASRIQGQRQRPRNGFVHPTGHCDADRSSAILKPNRSPSTAQHIPTNTAIATPMLIVFLVSCSFVSYDCPCSIARATERDARSVAWLTATNKSTSVSSTSRRCGAGPPRSGSACGRRSRHRRRARSGRSPVRFDPRIERGRARIDARCGRAGRR